MEKKFFKIYPEKRLYTIKELEKRLQFTFLKNISFESPEEKEMIRTKGLEKWKNNEISIEEKELGNRFRHEIKTGYIPAVSIHWIDENVGYGLFAEEDLSQGSYVGEYTGIVRENDKRYIEPLNNYCYRYPVLDDLGRDYVIDAIQGHLTRFINHSFLPNLKPTYSYYEGFYHLIFVAISPIKKYSQLTYNYGRNYWYIRSKPIEL